MAGDVIPGRYIVTLIDGADMHSVRADHGIGRSAVTASYHSVLRGFAAGMPEATAARLADDPRVRRVEPDRWVTVAATQSSPPSWGLDRIDERALPRSGTYTYGTTGKGVKAYVVDTGVRRTHDDFGRRVAAGWYAPRRFSSTHDCNGHGTHVAGTLGGRSFGVAKRVTIVPVKALGVSCGGGGYTSDIIDGILWIIEDHSAGEPAVANLSIEGAARGAGTLEEAVEASIDDGVTFVAAAGNSDQDSCNVSPARVPAVITVGATDKTDTRAAFSNFGNCVDLFAPGVQIKSTYWTSDTATKTMQGTSMAAPHVAGTAARYLQLKSRATPADVAAYIHAEATTGKVLDPGPDSPNRLLYAQRPARVSVSVSRSTITYGATVTVSGWVYDGDDTFDVGEVVKLQRRRVGTSTWKTVASASPSPQGEVSFMDAPNWSAEFRLRFSGGDEQPATSRRALVGVRTRVTAALNSPTVHVGAVARISGKVRPSHAGKTVTLQRYRGGKWKSISSGFLNGKSRYRFRLDTSAPGSYRYRVVKPADTDHMRGVSRARKLSVE